MNQIHLTLIEYIREQTKINGGELAQKLSTISDESMVRMMFSNYRGKEKAKGLRLTKFGLEVMNRYFKSYQIKIPEGMQMQAQHLLYLDKKAKMPYYYSNTDIIIYENELGIKLKLADGSIDTMIQIDEN